MMKKENFFELEDKTKIWFEFNKGNDVVPSVVFCHGNAQNSTSGKKILEYFKQKGHSTLAYDLPGHGKSEAYGDKIYTMKRFSQTLKAVLEKANMAGKIILIGHSMGGMIALQYAVEYPHRIRSIVLVDTYHKDPIKSNKDLPLKDIINSIIENSKKVSDKNLWGTQFRYDETPDLSEEQILEIGLKHTVPEALEGNFVSTYAYDTSSKLNMLKMPVLILRGENDSLIDKKMTDEMREQIKGSRLVTIKGYGHNFVIQSPDLLIKTLEETYSYLLGD